MIVERIVKRKVKKIKEGDKIHVGKYTATCVKVDGKDCIFLLDQYLDDAFTHQNLIPELNEHLLKDENFKEINAIIKPQDIYDDGAKVLYRVPFAGEMFSGTEEDERIRKNYEPDTSDGFLDIWECMKDRRNRIAFRENNCEWGWLMNEWGWLMNRVKNSATNFADVGSNGYSNSLSAGYSYGVRPVFVIENGKE